MSLRDLQSRCDACASAVERLERGMAGDIDAVAGHVSKCRSEVEAFALDNAVTSGPQKLKLDGLRSELDLLDRTVAKVRRVRDRQRTAAAEKEQLRARTTASGLGVATGDDNQQCLTHLQREQQSLQHTQREVSRMNEESAAVLDALRSQRARLSGVGAKLEGVMQGLGVSDQAIRQIRDMNKTDALIVVVGCVLLVVLMLYLWFG